MECLQTSTMEGLRTSTMEERTGKHDVVDRAVCESRRFGASPLLRAQGSFRAPALRRVQNAQPASLGADVGTSSAPMMRVRRGLDRAPFSQR
eukprot:4873983-Pleurochrysis_carterae.AAC.3